MEIITLHGSEFPYKFNIYKEMISRLSYAVLIHGGIKAFLNSRLWDML